MFKIYPDEYVSKQIIIPSIKGKIIFTFLEDNLEIIYGDMHIKISQKSINKVIIKENKESNFKKIFLKLQNNINMAYILYSSNIDIIKLKEFFKEFNLINEK